MRGYFLIITALVVWSTWGLAVRWFDKPAVVIAFYNALFALAFQGAGMLAARRRQRLYLGRDLGAVALLGVFGLANFLLYVYALKNTTIACAALTHYTAPVFVAALAPMLLADRMGRATLIALVLSVAGLALIFLRGVDVSGGVGLLGALAGVGSGLAYAFIIIIVRAISPRNHPVKLAFLPCLIAAALLAPFALSSGEAGLSTRQVMLFAVVGFAHSTAANVLYTYGMREVTAQDAGVLGYLEAALAILLAYVFLGETPSVLAILGGLLIVVSGVIVIRQGVMGVTGGMRDNRG